MLHLGLTCCIERFDPLLALALLLWRPSLAPTAKPEYNILAQQTMVGSKFIKISLLHKKCTGIQKYSTK